MLKLINGKRFQVNDEMTNFTSNTIVNELNEKRVLKFYLKF